jgi:hypothetical protein
MDAEICGVEEALAYPNVELRTNAHVERLLVEPDGKRIAGVEVLHCGERGTIGAKLVALAAGAVNSAALLLRSGERGLANRSDAVGRHFMNHNASAVVAVDPRVVNDLVYQKTLGINDFYLDDGRGGPPLGNLQLLGRVTAPILKANVRFAPEWALGLMSRRSVDWYAMSEDLPQSGEPRHSRRRADPPRLEAQQLDDPRDADRGFQGTPARSRLSDRPFASLRPPNALASVWDRSHRARARDVGPLGVSYPINPPPISFAFLRAAQEAGIPFNFDFNGAGARRNRALSAFDPQRRKILRLERVPEAGEAGQEPDGAPERADAEDRGRKRACRRSDDR